MEGNPVSRVAVRTRSLRIGVGGLVCAGLAHTPVQVQRPAAVETRIQSHPETEVTFLSGRGPEDAVRWDFFCTAGRGRRTWTTIPVRLVTR
jgi:hypothetical protein